MKNKIVILFLMLGFICFAQIPKDQLMVDIKVFPEEKAALFINSDVLLAGESLLYNISILNNSNTKSSLSKIAYVSLRDHNDSIVFEHKLKLVNGSASSNFFLPATLETGIYSLIGYTNFTRNNNKEAFDEKSIYVINTFRKNSDGLKIPDTIQVNVNTQNIDFADVNKKEKKINIILKKQKYGLREKISLEIEHSEKYIERYLLSARQITPAQIKNKDYQREKKDNSKLFYLPELRGEIISGQIFLDDKTPIAKQDVSLSISGEKFIFKLAKTDKNGRFFFTLSEDYDSENSLIQVVLQNDENKNYSIVLDHKTLHLDKTNPKFLKLDSSLKEYLQNRSVQLQIENAYFENKKDSLAPRRPHPAFYDKLGTLYQLDDYTRFPSLRETFIEVIQLAAIRGSGKTTRFLVYNPYDPKGYGKFRDIPPLVLMDGILIQNIEELLNYNVMEIKSIRVLNIPYRYGPKLFSGIISLETKKGDYKPSLMQEYIKEVILPPTVQERKSFMPSYSNQSNDRIPDYRVQLYWEPEFATSERQGNVSFYTSDVPGIYEIHLEGYDNYGEKIIVKEYIEVSEN